MRWEFVTIKQPVKKCGTKEVMNHQPEDMNLVAYFQISVFHSFFIAFFKNSRKILVVL